MLAQNFKTAADLGLLVEEFDALAKVLGMLEREELEKRPSKGFHHTREGEGTKNFAPKFFNMRFFAGAGSCGTVACICGWAEHVGRLKFFQLMQKRMDLPKLNELFDPTGSYASDQIEPRHAAIALRNYLTHGEPRWDEAMAI